MGHWLDGLVNAAAQGGGATIEWNGSTIPPRPIWAFSTDFDIVDDPTLGKVSIAIGTNGLPLFGDVRGSSLDNNIEFITGGKSSGLVSVLAEKFRFWNGATPSVVTAILQRNDVENDCLEILHTNKRALLAHWAHPTLGSTEAVNLLEGGVRFTTRAISVLDTTLDVATKDMLIFVDATAGSRNITLPGMVMGRTFVFVTKGAFAVTIKPGGGIIESHALDSMNGVVGANYVVPYAGACTIVTGIAGGWYARSFSDATVLAALNGDVKGAPGANRVEIISGDAVLTKVAVTASELTFAGPGSSVGAAIAVGFGEALIVTHGGQNVLVAHNTAPELGNTASVSRLHGGTRFDTKNIAADTTLDVSTKESVIYVDATAAARNITLPPILSGRTFVFMVTGAFPVTIKRAGANLINGLAADYVVPYANACVILTAVSTTWLARSFSDQQGVTMGPGQGSATASASKIFGFAFAASTNVNVDLTGASYTGLKTAIDAGKMLVVKAGSQCWYNWGTSSVTISAAATAASSPAAQGAPMFDGSESPERAPFGTTWMNILGGPVAGTLTVYIAE